jgi:hypothetical protein
MNDTSPRSNPAKRNRWLQFGTRSLFVLIVFAAIAAWFTKKEMNKEERREYWIALLPAQNHPAPTLRFAPNVKTSWSRHFISWLRGKPPTRAVDLVSLRDIENPSTVRELMEIFPSAHFEVDLAQGQASPDLLTMIATIKTLDSIEFRGLVDTSDESILRLGKVHPSFPFSLCVERIDDDLLRRLVDAKVHVRSIYASGSGEGAGWQAVTNEGLRLAAQLPFDSVHAHGGSDDQGLAHFKNQAAIQSVELRGPGYTDVSSETLATLPGLTSLSLVDTRLTDAGIAAAIAGRSLDSLKLDTVTLGEKSIDAIGRMTSLRMLDLRNVPLTDALAKAIVKQPIEALTLYGDYSDADLNALAPIAPTLTSIHLHAPHVTDQGLAWLGRANLSLLDLNHTQVTTATLKVLKATGNELILWLGGPNINAEFAEKAKATFKLETIVLFGQSIDDDVLTAFAPAGSRYHLYGTRVTAKGLGALKTDGESVTINICYPDDAPPPFRHDELEEVKQAAAGTVKVSLQAIERSSYERLVHGSSVQSVSEGKARE